MKAENTTLNSTLVAMPGNIELASGVKLEEGKAYILVIDASAGKDNVVMSFTAAE